MFELKNAQLTVSILDPIVDVARLGSRYCTGGYIWQVTDPRLGELLSGPEYPREPNTFDGQGMPDMFFLALGAETAPLGGEVGCIGVGKVRRTSPVTPFYVFHNREVIEFVRWEVEDRSTENMPTIVMQTEDHFQDWSYHLQREVSLHERAVTSKTTIQNQANIPLPVRWFAHPFFPVPEDNVLCRFSIPVSLPDNPGYFLNQNEFITRKPDYPWQQGYYQPLEYLKEETKISVEEKHPKTGQVRVKTDFMPSFLPIWGNDRTFSFEPYFDHELIPGEEAGWTIVYEF